MTTQITGTVRTANRYWVELEGGGSYPISANVTREERDLISGQVTLLVGDNNIVQGVIPEDGPVSRYPDVDSPAFERRFTTAQLNSLYGTSNAVGPDPDMNALNAAEARLAALAAAIRWCCKPNVLPQSVADVIVVARAFEYYLSGGK